MGVNGLWKVLEPCADYSQTLPQLAAKHYSSSTSQHRGLRVGIDISIWLVASKEVFSSTEGDLGPNPALRDLFFKLCRLLRAGVLPLLVFDGRSKPKVKRGRTIKGTGFDPASTLKMKELIDIFGMEWIEAAGEAEAELAELETAGILDAVVTLDSDFFVFGGRTLIKNTNLTQEEASLKRQEKEALAAPASSPIKALPSTSRLDPPASSMTLQRASQEVYEGVHHESFSGITTVYTGLAEKLGLDRQNLILYVLLTGGDYDDGLKGLGPESALRIIRAGLGEGFWIEAERRKTGEANFETWRELAAVELENRASGRRSQKGADLMRASIDFPSLQVLDNYDTPALSKCEQCGSTWSSLCEHRREFNWNREIDLGRLVEFCSRHFEWHSSQIVDRFRKNLWPGLVMKTLRLERLKVDLIRWKKNNPLESPPPTLTFSDSSPLSTLLDRCHKYSESSTYLPASGLPSFQFSLNQASFLSQLTPLLLSPDPRALTAEQLNPTMLNPQGVLPHPKKEFPLISEKPSDLRHWVGEAFTDVKISRNLILAFEEAEDEKLIVAQEKVDKQERKEEEKQQKKAEKELERERNDEVKARKAEERKREKDEKELRFKQVAKRPKARADVAGHATSSDGPGLDKFFPSTKRGLPSQSSLKSKGKKASPVVGAKLDAGTIKKRNSQWLQKHGSIDDDDEAPSSSIRTYETFTAPSSIPILAPSIPTTRRKLSRSTSPLLDPPFTKKAKLSPVPPSPVGIASTSSLTTRIRPAPRMNPTKSRSISTPPVSPAAKLSDRSSTAHKQGLGTKDDPIVIEDSD